MRKQDICKRLGELQDAAQKRFDERMDELIAQGMTPEAAAEQLEHMEESTDREWDALFHEYKEQNGEYPKMRVVNGKSVFY